MPARPQPHWITIDGECCWTIDWREFFRGDLQFWEPRWSGEMRGFHVVFQLRIYGSGTLIFWDDDGCVIRRNGKTIHADRSCHMLTRSQIEVRAGDRLEVAQWQHNEGWVWDARLVSSGQSLQESTVLLLPYLISVRQRLKAPNGPPLKMYFHGATPIRTVLAIYSMILNGYSPSGVLVFGEYQWSEQSREVFTALLPFAHIVPTEAVLARLQSLGQPRLIDLARQHWFVMKTCIGLLCPPTEFCFMDDDIVILDGVDGTLKAFQQHSLVFAQNADYSAAYLAVWGSEGRRQEPLPTGTLIRACEGTQQLAKKYKNYRGSSYQSRA
jgi:hypothetical protein